MQRILLAARDEEIAFPVHVLRGEFELVTCTDWNSAEAALHEDISLVICGVHFHNGQLYDLARLVIAARPTTDIPFYGIVVNDPDFSQRFIQCIRSALNSVGAQGALDLAGLRKECGDREASAMLQTAVEGLLMEAANKRYARLPPRHPSSGGKVTSSRGKVCGVAE